MDARTAAMAVSDHPVDPTGDAETLEFIQVAFSGHSRAADVGDRDKAQDALKAAFALLAQAGVSHARLLTGAERGADGLAMTAWADAGLGPIQVVSPFLEGPLGSAAALAQSPTRLPGNESRAAGRSPHLAQARWLVAAADILVVFWSGRPPRGPGGTGDVVRLALEHGTPVLWARPGGGVRLIRPDRLDPDIGLLELQRQLAAEPEPLVVEATPQAVRATLMEQGIEAAAMAEQPDAEEGRRPPQPARAYGLFRRALGGRSQPHVPRAIPADLAEQSGFAGLSAARSTAASEARRLASVHRSHQVILLGIAILAAATGSSSALAPGWKTGLVGFELLLGLLAFFVWLSSERGERHRRWTDARKLAEDLRLERAAWVVGVSTVPHGAAPTSSKTARRARRRAGLPNGAFDVSRVSSWGAWVEGELIAAQIDYHRNEAHIDGRISHRVHQVENWSFGLLIIVLVSYLVITLILLPVHGHPPKWLGGVVLMTGAVVPAIGAAGLALEATLSLGEQARRSRRLADQLEALQGEVGGAQTLERIQALTRAALRLHRAHEDHWSEDVGRRRLFRGG